MPVIWKTVFETHLVRRFEYARSRPVPIIIIVVVPQPRGSSYLGRTKVLGAFADVNYRHRADWADEVLALTDGRRVALAIDIGEASSLNESVRATAVGGTVVSITFCPTNAMRRGNHTAFRTSRVRRPMREESETRVPVAALTIPLPKH